MLVLQCLFHLNLVKKLLRVVDSVYVKFIGYNLKFLVVTILPSLSYKQHFMYHIQAYITYT